MITLNGTTGITNDGGYTGDGVVFADTTPANTLVTTTGGHVGIGTSSPTAKLESAQNIGFGTGGTFGPGQLYSDANWGLIISAKQASPAQAEFAFLNAGGTERARIDSSGNLLVGTTSSAAFGNGFAVRDPSTGTNASIGHINGTASGSGYVLFGYNNSGIGSITQNGTTAVAYNTTSDYRLKENVQPIAKALDRVAALKPCTYTWKSAPDEIGEGFIAHELAEVCPQAVSGEKDAVDAEGNPVYQGIDTSFLVATLTAAIQEQQAIITAQASQIQQLREKVLEVEEGTSNMLVENTNNLYETITALTARVAALEGK